MKLFPILIGSNIKRKLELDKEIKEGLNFKLCKSFYGEYRKEV